MAFLPVVTREMCALARRQSTYRSRSFTAVLAVLTMMWLLLVSAAHVSLANLGSSIFMILSAFCFGFSLLAGMHTTADCVSEEKREGTLGLLFLTDLRGLHIVFGKLVASSLNVVFAVLGVVPMLALALLLGGVTLQEVAWVAVVLLNSIFLSLSMGVFVSTLSKNERKAMFACFVCIFLLTIMPFAIGMAFTEFDRVPEEVVWLSPLYTFLCIQATPARGFNASFFSVALLFQHLLGWTLLLAASRILPRCVNELPARRFRRLRAVVDTYVFGNREQRARYRALLLDRNAFLWLASRERVKPRYAWTVVGFFLLLFLWVGTSFPNMFFDPPVPLTIIFLVHFILKLWTGSEVCSRLINDRRSGALELLLSSPLGVREIAEGQGLALRRIFRWPVLVLVGAEVVLMTMALREGRGDTPVLETILLYGTASSTLLLDLWAIKWVGLWLSLFGKSIERVLFAVLARVLLLPTLCFAVISGTLTAVVALQSEKLPVLLTYSLWLILGCFFSLLFGSLARLNFFRYFREVASQQYDPRAVRTLPVVRDKTRTRTLGSTVWAMFGRRWLVTGTTFLLLILVLGGGARRIYWKRKVSVELARIRTSNLPATSVELGSFFTPVPRKEDGFGFLRENGQVNWGRRIQPSYALQLAAQWKKGDAAPVVEAERILALNAAQLAALKALYPFTKAYIDPHSISAWYQGVDFPGYLSLGMADLLVALHHREGDRAHADLRALLAMARLLRTQPLLVMQNNCFVALNIWSAALEITLSECLLDSGALLDLQHGLEDLDRDDTLIRTLCVERALLVQPSLPGNVVAAVPVPPFVSVASGLLSAVGSYDQEMAKTLEDYRNALSLCGSDRLPLLSFAAAKNKWWPSGPAQGFAAFDTIGGWKLFSIVCTDLSISARLQLLRTAVAVERYQTSYNRAPSPLSRLAPEFVERLPLDPFTKQPMERNEDSGLLLTPERKFLPHVNPERLSILIPSHRDKESRTSKF